MTSPTRPMKSRRGEGYRQALARLPIEIAEAADKAFAFFEKNPGHPSLDYKHIGRPNPTTVSARVTKRHRVLGDIDHGASGEEELQVFWWWIGDHDEYERIIG